MLIYPVSCRTEFLESTEEYFEAVDSMLDGVAKYLTMFPTIPKSDCTTYTPADTSRGNSEARSMKEQMKIMKALYVKMHKELAMAKREIAWGKLRTKDLTSISNLCRKILMPLVGIAQLPDIFEHVAENGGWGPCDFDDPDAYTDYQCYGVGNEEIWQRSISELAGPALVIIGAMKDGLKHVGMQLEIVPSRKEHFYVRWFANAKESKSPDVESDGDSSTIGTSAFSAVLERKLARFLLSKSEYLDTWANSRGLTPEQLNKVQNSDVIHEGKRPAGTPGANRILKDRQQLYLLLYIQHMLYTTGIAVLELCRFSDDVVASGTMSKSRLIVPSLRILCKWFLAIWDTADASLPDDERPRTRKEQTLLFGTSGKVPRNIEHLPPSNAYQRFGVRIQRFQEFLKGPELSFGFRSACATLSCAIIACLHQTQEIFTHYRLIWSVIIAAIGANMSAGQSGVSYALRIMGSFAALIICYIVWYIPNGHVSGVIVMMWFASFCQMYFLIKWPKYIIGWLVVLITEVLSIGYELQVKKIGKVKAESTGIYVFPPYYVAALRVACVLWGTCVSIFFTYLPYPITARGLLRKDMAVVIQLLANYHAVVHSTIKARLLGKEGDESDKNSRGNQMARTRKAMFNKVMTLSDSINHNLYLQKYEPGLGGRFPVVIFQDIMSQLAGLLDLISLLSFATQVWEVSGLTKYGFHHSPESHVWLSDLAKLMNSIKPVEENITSVLCQLSAAVSTGRALPPRASSTTPFRLSKRLRSLDPEVLHLEHVLEPGYSAHAVMEVISSMITYKIDHLVTTVEDLVGVINFEFEEESKSEKGKTH